jgi:hypothetical protein
MELNLTNFNSLKNLTSMLKISLEIGNIFDIITFSKFGKGMNIPDEFINYIYENLEDFSKMLINIENNNFSFNFNQKTLYEKIKFYIYFKTSPLNLIRQNVKIQFDTKRDIYKEYHPTKELVYPNQQLIAKKIIHEFNIKDRKAVTLVAQPQVGKTGTFLYLCILASTNENDKQIFLPQNIFIISGMNDKDWEKQTKGDMIDLFKDNIFHLGQLHNFENKIIDKKDNRILIIIDECQIATSENQKIDKILNSIYDKCSQFDVNNDIRFLNVSATPGAILYDMLKWGNKHKLIFLEPPETYVGFNVFLQEKRLLNSQILSEDVLNNEILPLLKNRFKKPKYHIFRELNSIRRDLLEKFCNENNYIFQTFDSESNKNKQSNLDIDSIINNPPKKHHIIVIKQFWRAGKRMIDKNIGIAYEHNENIDIDITAQGLVARFCGNDKQYNNKYAPIFFCNIETIKLYNEFIEKGCILNNSDYLSNKLKIIEGELIRNKNTIYNKEPMFDKDNENSILEKKDYIDIPREYELTESEYTILNNDEKPKDFLILGLLHKKDKQLFRMIKLGKYIHHTIREPITDKDYKLHILDISKAIEQKIPKILDIKKDCKENKWCCYIDIRSKPKRFFITIYHGSKRFKKNKKFLDNIDFID